MKTTSILKSIAGVAAGIVLMGGGAYAQCNTDVTLNVSNAGSANTGSVHFGVNTSATDGIDTALGELSLPPAPPSSVFEARMINAGPASLGLGSPEDFRRSLSSSQRDTFRLHIQAGAAGYPLTIAWTPASVSSQYTSANIVDAATGSFVTANMLTASSVTIPTSFSFVTDLFIITQGPKCTSDIDVSGCPLDFGVVQIPTPGTGNRTLTISNPGATTLRIDSVTSSAPAFTITSPASFPQNITTTPLTVNVRFTAPGAGSFSSNITIYYNGNRTSVCTATASASAGEGIYFLGRSIDTIPDNSTGGTKYIGLKYSGGTPVQGLQFKINVPNNIEKIRNVMLGPSLANPGNWTFDYQVNRTASQSEIKVLLYGRDTTVNLPQGAYDSLFAVHYDVANLKLCNGASGGDDTTSIMWLSDVQSALATRLGQTANIGVDADRDTTTFRVYNMSSRGDVNCDDRVDVLDLLEINDVILGRKTFAPWQFNRADLAPWSSLWAAGAVFSDATNYGDNKVNVQDLVLITNAILNENWPDSKPLMLPAKDGDDDNGTSSASAPAPASGIYDVKFTYAVTGSGINVRMNNLVPVKGFQMKIKSDEVPENIQVSLSRALGVPFVVTTLVKDGELRLVAQSANGLPIVPMNGEIMNIPFVVNNPGMVAVMEPLVAGGADNQDLIVEQEIVSGAASVNASLPGEVIHMDNMPNPFDSKTNIRYTLMKASAVTVVVTDAAGREVARLVKGAAQSAGTHTVEFDGSSLPNGTYYATVTAAGTTMSQKMVLAR